MPEPTREHPGLHGIDLTGRADTAVLLCGGLGTRLRPLTDELPKALVPVQGRPLLWHVVQRLVEQGFQRFVLPTGYMGERIRTFAPTLRREFGVEVHCVETGVDTTVGARLAAIAPLLPGDDVLLANGDTLFDLDLRQLHRHHRRERALATLTSVEIPSRFGLIVERQGEVTDFVRDAAVRRFELAGETARTGFLNAGFAWLHPELFDRFALEQCTNFEVEVYGALARSGELAHMPLSGFWFCVDTVRDWQQANAIELPSALPTEIV